MNEHIESDNRYGDVVFTKDHLNEAERLLCINQTYDDVSRAQIRARGLAPGWRCIDVGAGNGHLAMWLADQPELASGEIVALDRDVRLLHKLPYANHNIRIVEHDITTDGEIDGLG